MMRFERRYEGRDFRSLRCVDIVLKYAPVTFTLDALERLGALLREHRTIERNTSDDLGARLAAAVRRAWEARAVWDYLERTSGARQAVLDGSSGASAKALIREWEQMGLVSRTDHEIQLVTQTRAVIAGKCPECGALEHASTEEFLEDRQCKACSKTTVFVLTPERSPIREVAECFSSWWALPGSFSEDGSFSPSWSDAAGM
jgi:hypothetical protein